MRKLVILLLRPVSELVKHLCLKITLTKELSEGKKEKNASNCLSNARNMAIQVTGLTF